MKLLTYLRVAFATTYNIIAHAVTLGHYVWLEGRVRFGAFLNWGRRYRYRPAAFAQPTTEGEIVRLVKNATNLRLFGSAHSFNTGVVTEGTLVSLDRYAGVVSKDPAERQMTFRAGTRVRDVIRTLKRDGLAFAALPSHDAQSIGGILSTDVHGTGRDWGFVSDSVVGLKIVDGQGEIHEVGPTDDLFRAAIGGVGAVGIIVEVTVQAVDRFNVRQKFWMSDLPTVEANVDELLAEHEHFSLYLFPFTDKVQISTWNRTTDRRSFLGTAREFVFTSADALIAAWIGNLAAYAGLLRQFSSFGHGLKRGTNLVMESNKAFSRTIYHLHQELEFTVPFEDTFDACRRFTSLYEEMYPGLPYTLLEVRFTPAGHDRTLLGAGRQQRSTWIDLVCDDSAGFERYYGAAEDVMKEIGARPHLGKWCESFDHGDLERLHGEHYTRFVDLVREHDPDGKFANDFTRRLFDGSG
jgi:FAD/FMN-containing dehydrogenase